jgi:predicted MFS family arabinose efflux permease
VTGSSAVAALVGPERRGEAIGVYGLAVALPNLLLLPAGPWIAERTGFWVVFVISALPVAGIPAALRLAGELRETSPVRVDLTGPSATGEPVSAAYRHLLRPAVLLTSVTLAGGAAITFVPQMTRGDVLGAMGLFVMGVVTTVARWRAGPIADRHGTRRFLWPLLLVAAAGTALIGWPPTWTGRTWGCSWPARRSSASGTAACRTSRWWWRSRRSHADTTTWPAPCGTWASTQARRSARSPSV